MKGHNILEDGVTAASLGLKGGSTVRMVSSLLILYVLAWG